MLPQYHTLDQLINMIDDTQRPAILALTADIQDNAIVMPGSTSNHQAWVGGYLDHVVEVMNLGLALYGMFFATGRLEWLEPNEQFCLSDVLLVMYLHDLEKAFRIELDTDGLPKVDHEGKYVIRANMKSKSDREAFKTDLITRSGIVLTDQQAHALHFVEGIRDADYSPSSRTMYPLDTLCHMCDLASARIFYDFPKPGGDTWSPIGHHYETFGST